MVPAVVREMDDREMLEIAIIENVQRADLNAVEEAEAYKYRQDCGSPECYWRASIEKVA